MSSLYEKAKRKNAALAKKYQSKLTKEQILSKIPEGPEQKALLRAVQRANESSDKKEREARWLKLGLETGGALGRALKAIALCALFLIGGARVSEALPFGQALPPEVKDNPVARASAFSRAIKHLDENKRWGYSWRKEGAEAKNSGILYAPIPQFHRYKKPEEIFFEIGIGVEYLDKDRVDLIVPASFNAGEVLRRIFSGKTLKERVSYPDLTFIFFGPMISVPLNNDLFHFRPLDRLRFVIAFKGG